LWRDSQPRGLVIGAKLASFGAIFSFSWPALMAGWRSLRAGLRHALRRCRSSEANLPVLKLRTSLLGLVGAALTLGAGCSDKFEGWEDAATCSGDGDGNEPDAEEPGEGMGGGGAEECVGECLCASSEVYCADECVDPASNVEFCGAKGSCSGDDAGVSCGDTELCMEGQCVLQCAEGQIECGGACVEPLEDQNYCGASGDCSGGNLGEVCEAGEFCSGGVCRAWGEAELIASLPDGNLFGPKLAMSPGGSALLTYGGSGFMWFSRDFARSSDTWEAEQTLLSGVGVNTSAIGMSREGNRFILHGGLSMRSKLNGAAFEDLPGQTAGGPVAASISVADDNSVALAWRVSGVDGIWTSFFSPDSQSWAPVRHAWTEEGFAPSIVTDGVRTLLVAEKGLGESLSFMADDGDGATMTPLPGETLGGATRPSVHLNAAGEGLVSYYTEPDGRPEQTWAVAYSFDDDEWGEHFLLSEQRVSTISSMQGAIAYGLVDSALRTEIWWAANQEDLTGFPEGKSQILLDKPSDTLVAAVNDDGSLMILFRAEGNVYWSRLMRTSGEWTEPVIVAQSPSVYNSSLAFKLDRAGRSIAVWSEPNPLAREFQSLWSARLE